MPSPHVPRVISATCVCAGRPVTVKLVNLHEFEQAGTGSDGAGDFRPDSGRPGAGGKEDHPGIGGVGRRRHRHRPVPAIGRRQAPAPRPAVALRQAGRQRRTLGRPSTNVQWGNHTCVLAGDWMYMQAFQIALRERSFEVLDLLVPLTQMMVEGELLQLERIGRIDVTEADCMELVDRKTACLFSVCARLGGMAGHTDPRTIEKLGEYAWNLGMAFQLVDDVLDFTAREKTLGKPVGGDLREGKVTLPLVYALERATADERALVETILRDRSYQHVPFKRILALLEKYQGIARVKDRAQAFTDKARQTIGEFPESPYQRALLAVTDLITERDH